MREVPATNRVRAVIFAGIGNLLELYDYVLFGVMLPIIAPLFFPTSSPTLSLLIGYVGLALSFFIAPMGALFWGYLGDKFGRAVVLKNSLILMAIPSLLIGWLPTYEEVGILAPILLLSLRIFQGLSASGETLGSKIYAMESLGEKSYGLSSGLISGFGSVGVIMAMSAGLCVSSQDEIGQLWRVPFVVSALLFIVGLLIRTLSHKPSKHSTHGVKLSDSAPKNTLLVFAMGAVLGVLSYNLLIFLSPFLMSIGASSSSAYKLAIIGLFTTMLSSIASGLLYDRIKNKKALLLGLLIITIVSIPISYIGLTSMSYPAMVMGIMCLGASLGAFSAIAGVIIFAIFPKEIRCRRVFFPHTLGVCLFGGVTPFVLGLSGTLHVLAPSILITIFLIIAFLIIKKEAKHVLVH